MRPRSEGPSGEGDAGVRPRLPTGHRMLPHTADLIIEAWAPTRVGCLEEAVRALVDSFARISAGAPARPFPISIAPGADDAMLVALLEEVMFVLDALGSVPIDVTLSETEDEGVTGVFGIAPVDALQTHGPAPKGVSLEGLVFGQTDGGWSCEATIDV